MLLLLDFPILLSYTSNINASPSAVRPGEVFISYNLCHNLDMSKCVLFIDGENFLHKIEEVLDKESKDKQTKDITNINFNNLFKSPLQGLNLSRKIFYAAKLHLHPSTKKKSQELIKLQRKLNNALIKQGFDFIIAGNVRAQNIGKEIIFREKGVDVKIAVDLVSLACNKELDTAILCSSDSDLQPAISELKKRGIEVIYLGFELNPNKGLSYTTNRTILFRNSEIVNAFKNA